MKEDTILAQFGSIWQESRTSILWFLELENESHNVLKGEILLVSLILWMQWRLTENYVLTIINTLTKSETHLNVSTI